MILNTGDLPHPAPVLKCWMCGAVLHAAVSLHIVAFETPNPWQLREWHARCSFCGEDV